MQRKLLWAGVFLLAPGLLLAQEDVEAVGQKAKACAPCHGEDGNGINPLWAKLAGQHPAYLQKQLLDMQKADQGGRYVPAMLGAIAELSPEDIQDIAKFYSSIPRTTGKVPAALVEEGRKIYFGGTKNGVPPCSGCHSSRGQGLKSAAIPALAGQYAEYVSEQMRLFAKGERKNDRNGVMRDLAKRMSAAEIDAVSHYVAGMR